MSRPTPHAILLDMDGVLYHGEQPLPGAATFLERLAETPCVLVTNNPIRSPEQITERLATMGLPRPEPAAILTSADATSRWLARTRPDFRFFAVGAPGLRETLRQVGVEDPDQADFVVVGEGPGLDFEQLTIGINLILQRGARLIATNPDATVDEVRDGRHMLLPGGGALVAPFAAATGVTPTVIGKPEPLLYEMALERLDCPAGACLMIGDRPDTDIAGAERLGMWTALVRTGRFAPGARWPAAIPEPDWDVTDLATLTKELEATCPGLLAG
ncbi:putative sugar phosphatase of HAD superfamily [Thioflavicoccus mobilis 8321]|uniref:Putative sugar phosphatase of HAD superfamily n=1 Tax=Thioflavicoccus mobilis 8321 TaxID=765912 RepID=L0GST8_9GAMM|nr:HAD-IIA family hydrolase [Thioflavicoccus mobilis]AGA89046.1 putative sugar phosphatase of HAD superfamily [Thioflavicoccus mobilis 8321]